MGQTKPDPKPGVWESGQNQHVEVYQDPKFVVEKRLDRLAGAHSVGVQASSWRSSTPIDENILMSGKNSVKD